MARDSALLPKRKPRENQYLFDLGVRGRKTGLTLPDTGVRDENGLELMDHLFSSPEKSRSKSPTKTDGIGNSSNATISSEEDMDVGESTIPEPVAILTERKRANIRLPIPRSKSPIKTFLQSPARRNPSLGPISSPARGSLIAPGAASISASVRRKLNFSSNGFHGSEDNENPQGSPRKGANGYIATGATKLASSERFEAPLSYDEDEAERGDITQEEVGFQNGEDSFQMVDGGDDEAPEQVDETDEQIEPEPVIVKGKGKMKGVVPAATNKRGRPKKIDVPVQEDEQRPAKRTRNSLQASAPAKIKGGKPKKTAINSNRTKIFAASQKSKMSTIFEAESPEIQRGPPMPKNNRGLFILRRETPMEGTGFKQTRSGRNSIKPLAYWKNERVEYSEDENEDNFGKFVLPRIKEVVRADEIEQPKRHTRAKSRAPKSKKRQANHDSEEEYDDVEPWELEPGHVYGDIRTWDPEDPTGAQAEEAEEELALSSAAIITTEIAGASFRFAKTLTLPFFGAGMVDLPPGAIKKPKSSRRMQMAFFVFYGRVEVTVNDNVFRIGKGGMWQVPRGNFYSIHNDYDSPARIFFSQGCEVFENVEERS